MSPLLSVKRSLIDPRLSLLSLYTFRPTSFDVRQLPLSAEVSEGAAVVAVVAWSVFADGLCAKATFASSAEAGDRRWRHHRHNGGEAAAAGIIGFAAGAILGGALSGPRYYSRGYYDRGYYNDDYYGYYGEPDVVYVEPAPVYVQPQPVYRYAMEPWTPEWYAYCDAKYRSFNADTGYYKGYDGRFHLCQ